MPAWSSCTACICAAGRARSVYLPVLVRVCLCGALPFCWWVAGLSRTSWPAVQGTTVTSDPQPVGDPGRRWHDHKSTDTEHVEAFRRQTHHLLLPARCLPLCPPLLLSVKSKVFPWKYTKQLLINHFTLYTSVLQLLFLTHI